VTDIRFDRERVLDASGALFAARGFDGTSFRDITATTGAKRSLLLYHFTSKEELWRLAMKRVVARLDAAIAERGLPPSDTPDAEKIALSLRAYIDSLVAVPEYGRILLREGVTAGPRLDWLVAHFVPAFAFDFELQDRSADTRIRGTMLRDVAIGAPLFATALGPFLERSTAAATHAPNAGIHPMSAARRDELIDLLVRLILGTGA
jgi:AcrR family transcriptional regulator